MRPVTAIALLAGMLPLAAFAGGLEHVKQTIFGMDCAPCAYGIEKGLKGLSGVEQVKVSLNDGYAEVHLGEGSRATLAEMREVIRKNGFTPKDAKVQASGKVVQASDGQFLLQTGVETFQLIATDRAELSQLSAEALPVSVTGSIATGKDQPLTVTVVE